MDIYYGYWNLSKMKRFKLEYYRFGRRVTVMVSIFLTFVCTLAVAWVPSFVVYCVYFRFGGRVTMMNSIYSPDICMYSRSSLGAVVCCILYILQIWTPRHHDGVYSPDICMYSRSCLGTIVCCVLCTKVPHRHCIFRTLRYWVHSR